MRNVYMNKERFVRLRRLHGNLYDRWQNEKVVKKGYLSSIKIRNSNHTTEDYPVDFVVLWLDSKDPEWQKAKAQYMPQEYSIQKSNHSARFRDWEIFRYWFRSVEKYAPWVRHVYLVTCGHLPTWINLDSPKLKFVRHDQFIPKDYLPTFSCFPTELNLWRIEGISEHIVYFNDDMFLTRPVEKSDFFCNGLPRYSAIAEPPYPIANMTAWKHNLFNNAGVINSCFNVSECIEAHPEKWFSALYAPNQREWNLRAYKDNNLVGVRFYHLGVPYRCSTMRLVWETIPERLDSSCKNRFRTMDDVFHQLFQLWEMMQGTFEPVSSDYYGKVFNITPERIDSFERCFLSEDFRMVCANDSEDLTDEGYEFLNGYLKGLFEKKYPEKSSFEK